MIKLCKNLFYKPKYGSDADSIMLKHLFSTVATILVCLAAISFSAYAFFSYHVTSGSNTIKSSSFSASVKIENNQTLVTKGYIQSYNFNAPGKYTVTITADDGTTGTGFYIIKVGDTKYYTQQLGVDLNAPGQKRTQISFTLELNAATEVTFESHWGTTSFYGAAPIAENEFYIVDAETITVNASANSADAPEEGAFEETGSEESKSEEAGSEDPTQEGTTSEETTSSQTVHTVLPGESLASIAEKYGTTYPILAAYNEIDDPRVIQPGQEIHIPEKTQINTNLDATQ